LGPTGQWEAQASPSFARAHHGRRAARRAAAAALSPAGGLGGGGTGQARGQRSQPALVRAAAPCGPAQGVAATAV